MEIIKATHGNANCRECNNPIAVGGGIILKFSSLSCEKVYLHHICLEEVFKQIHDYKKEGFLYYGKDNNNDGLSSNP